MQYNKQYAKTLFEVCEKADCIRIIQNQLYSVSYLFNKVPVFRLVLITKRIDNQNKINIIKNTLIKFNPLIVEFLSIIINILLLFLIKVKLRYLFMSPMITNSCFIIHLTSLIRFLQRPNSRLNFRHRRKFRWQFTPWVDAKSWNLKPRLFLLDTTQSTGMDMILSVECLLTVYTFIKSKQKIAMQ